MSMPAISIIFGIEPRVAMPISAQAVQSIAMPARRAASRAGARCSCRAGRWPRVVGLAGVAEAPGDRAEDDGRADGGVAERVQQVEPAVGLDVEDEVELGLRLVGQEVADLEPGAVEQRRRRGRCSRTSAATAVATCAGSVRSTWCQCAVPPAAAIASSASSAARARSIRASSRSTSFGVGRSPRSLIRSASSRLSPSRSVAKRARSGSSGSGSGDQVEQVEGAAGGRRQVGGDRRDDAAGGAGDDEDGRPVASARSGSGSAGRSTRPTVQRSSSAWPTSTAPGSRSVSSIRRSASAAVLRLGGEVDGLDQRLGALARERLGEAGDGAAHRPRSRRRRRSRGGRRGGSPRRGRCPAAATLLGERAHRRREQLDADAQALAPGRGIERGERPLVVERRQPVDALDRALGRPARRSGPRASSPAGSPSISRTSTPSFREPLRERGADAAADRA